MQMVLGIDVEWRLQPGTGCVEAGRVCRQFELAYTHLCGNWQDVQQSI